MAIFGYYESGLGGLTVLSEQYPNGDLWQIIDRDHPNEVLVIFLEGMRVTPIKSREMHRYFFPRNWTLT